MWPGLLVAAARHCRITPVYWGSVSPFVTRFCRGERRLAVLLVTAQEPGAAAEAAPPHEGRERLTAHGGWRKGLAFELQRHRRNPALADRVSRDSRGHLLWNAHNDGLGLCSCLKERAQTQLVKMSL